MHTSDNIGLLDKGTISDYIPLTLLGERQRMFIKYLGEDLGYDWQ